ncbi:MAG TPA: hypothetical protein VGL93_10565 [Streptosporangiaceae bacterium]
MGIPAVPPPPAPPTIPAPLTGDPVLDGEASVRGLVMSPYAARGPVRLLRFNPYGVRAVRETDEDKPGMHGSYTGPDYLPSLQIPMSLRVSVGSMAGAVALLTQVVDAFAPLAGADDETTPLLWRMDGRLWLRWVKPRLLDPDTSRIGAGAWTADGGVTAPDPLYYLAEPVNAPTLSLAAPDGVPVPLDVPVVLPPRTGIDTATITNEGTQPAPLLLTLRGPGRGLGAQIDGTAIWWDLELADGDVLLVDTDAGTALLNGSAYRAPAPGSAVTSLFRLPRGAHTLRMLGTPTTTARPPTLDVQWRHTYL